MAKSKTVFSTAYFPSVAMMAAMMQYAQDGHILIEQMETFPKQTHRNRTIIITANGAMPLSVPVVRTNGNHTFTKDIAISYTERWNLILPEDGGVVRFREGFWPAVPLVFQPAGV
ncbi:MAG: WbqC family protein [Bacteroidales bacterium]|nr:WbqC family protein [Bacteroidales bacterium]